MPSPAAIRALPTAALAGAGVGLVWDTHGSIAAVDWLPYALLAALVVLTVAVAEVAVRPPRTVLVGGAALAGLAAWDAISIVWSPLPSLARDESLLVVLYLLVLAVPALTLVESGDRLLALGAVVAALSANAVVTAVRIGLASDPFALFSGGRLAFPISYVNANAALFAVGFWPAAVLAARRASPLAVRALALGAAMTLLAAALSSQSKGALLGLVVSALLLFGLAPARLRLAVPAAIAAVLSIAGFSSLTAPYRNSSVSGAHGVGWAILWLGAAALGAGAVYAWIDRRLELGERTRRTLARAAAVAVVVAVAAGIAGFLAVERRPGGFFERKWTDFKTYKTVAIGSSHLGSLGSNRYDFWRVALDEWAHHPLQGVGARGFSVVYLEHRRSTESPRRAHSLPLDTLSEDGVVGFVLLVLALGAPLVYAGRRLQRVPAAGAFGAGVYGVVHCAVDWTWTFPTFGLPLFLLLGIGCASDARRHLARAGRLVASLAPLAVAVLVLAPTWIAGRLVSDWLLKSQFLLVRPEDRPAALDDARWAHRLDPLSVDPLLVESRLAPTLADSIRILRKAIDREPDAVALRLEMAERQLAVGDKEAARATLAKADELLPRDRRIAALRREAAR